jgi:hypothetical protein
MFDSALLALGDVLFLSGLTMTIGKAFLNYFIIQSGNFSPAPNKPFVNY